MIKPVIETIYNIALLKIAYDSFLNNIWYNTIQYNIRLLMACQNAGHGVTVNTRWTEQLDTDRKRRLSVAEYVAYWWI